MASIASFHGPTTHTNDTRARIQPGLPGPVCLRVEIAVSFVSDSAARQQRSCFQVQSSSSPPPLYVPPSSLTIACLPCVQAVRVQSVGRTEGLSTLRNERAPRSLASL